MREKYVFLYALPYTEIGIVFTVSALPKNSAFSFFYLGESLAKNFDSSSANLSYTFKCKMKLSGDFFMSQCSAALNIEVLY